MKTIVHVSLLSLVLTLSAGAQQPERPPLAVTYVANEGFMVECAGKKLLIDALFGGFVSDWCQVPTDSVVELMTTAQPPFDNVDLIAVTHAHVDHFNTDIVAAHMKHGRRATLVCTPLAAEKLQASEHYPEIKDRIRVVPAPGDSAVAMELAGIGLRVLPTRHGPYWEKDEQTGESVDRHRNVQHLEFIFSLGGRKLFHCGDAPRVDVDGYRPFDLDREHIDVAFLHWWGSWDTTRPYHQFVRDVIRPQRIFLMHLMPGQVVSGQPEDQVPVAREVIVPKRPMENWTVR